MNLKNKLDLIKGFYAEFLKGVYFGAAVVSFIGILAYIGGFVLVPLLIMFGISIYGIGSSLRE